MQQFVGKWFKISLVSLAVVALLGCVLRYKIAYSLPVIDQKFLLHAHSHFAFAGWITQVLMACLVGCLKNSSIGAIRKKYNILLTVNLVCAYGMLISFALQGYALFSITFSTLSILVSYAFAITYWRDLNRSIKTNAHNWFKAAVIFNALSSLGAFSLAYMMAIKNMHQQWYMGAIYFFLHFQYNGWFFFGCMGLFLAELSKLGIASKYSNLVFVLFTLAIVPNYFLAVLWLHPPLWLYSIIIAGAALLWVALWYAILSVKPVIKQLLHHTPTAAKWVGRLAALALCIKIVLQGFSVIPSLNQLVFGFRPIVIGYLHLVFLGISTLFIIAYGIQQHYITISKTISKAIYAFTAGVILNEALLMAQGLAALWYINIPFINQLLLAAAVTMFSSCFVMSSCQFGLFKKTFYSIQILNK